MLLGRWGDPVAPSCTRVALQVAYIRIKRFYESKQFPPRTRQSDAPAGLLKSIQIDIDSEVARTIAARRWTDLFRVRDPDVSYWR